MFFIGLGTAAPAQRYSQRQCWDTLLVSKELGQLTPRSQAILKKVLLGDNGIETRHLALDRLSVAFELNPDTLHARYVRNAPTLAATAAERALRDAHESPGSIDAILISTCTGYLCPGLSSYVSEQLALRPDALALDFVGQGCAAALPNLRAAEALLTSNRAGKVLSICVEVCSAAFYLDNDPGVLVSACLFGDGAGAAVLSNQPKSNRRRVQWRMATTTLSPVDRDYLRFEQRGGMLRNILTQQVPSLAGKYAEIVLADALQQSGLSQERISGWLMHAGGREILSSMRHRLGLTEHDLRWSSAVLREYGNVSSACVLFVLEAALAGRAAGGFWWISSFGAGFTCHGALLEVES